MIETRNKYRKTIQFLVKIHWKIQKKLKKLKKSPKISDFFPNQVKCGKYAPNHNRWTAVDKKNYCIIET